MLLIIGLDGATWDLLGPWIEQGRLPHLAGLQRRGSWGPLVSTMPPATFPSWTTFMTGVNPGRHGIFDFTRRQLGTYDVRFVNASFRKAPTVWRRLSDQGRRVCVLGLPGTYPPEPLNGCMISGFDTPVTTRADASFVTPATLAPLVMRSGGFPFADFQEFRVGDRWYRMALSRLLQAIEHKTRLGLQLVRRERWECFLLLFGESDTVAHHFWKFHDPQSPRFDARRSSEFGDAIRRVYEALDAAVGALTGAVPEATVLVVSDHGFGGAGNTAVHLNRWLQQQGLQRSHPSGTAAHLAGSVKRFALRTLPAGVQAKAFRLNEGRWASRLESRSRFAGIEWAHTRAFSEELNYFPSVWLNLKGREPEGLVDPGDYERVRQDVCAAAAELRDPQHGRAIVRRAWRREELYDGPWVKYAPDIILEFALDAGYSYTCLPTSSAPTADAVRRLGADDCGDGKLAGMSGSHRADGIFLVCGGEIGAQPYPRGFHIADMGPSILSLCGVRPPAEFDGRTIDPVVRVIGGAAGASDVRRAVVEEPYADAEERELVARLTAMGYLQ